MSDGGLYPAAPPPSDVEAERWTLSAMFGSPQAVLEASEIVGPGDFYQPAHQAMFEALRMLLETGEAISPVTVAAWMAREGHGAHQDYVTRIWDLRVPPSAVADHARIVWEKSIRRKGSELGIRFSQFALDASLSPADVVARGQKMMADLSAASIASHHQALSPEAFVDLDAERNQVVIPGMLNYGDRVVVVGGEGAGKTVLAHQVGFALAAGAHPFTGDPIEPGRVLIVDLENPLPLLQKRVRGFLGVVKGCPGWDDANLSIWARPGGINLFRADDAFELADVIRRSRPDLVVAGPIYKMFEESDRDGPRHAAICRFFDKMRERHGCAIWLETHAPITMTKGDRDMRPIGSGIWTRWPEFGITLSPAKAPGAMNLNRFRGDRDESRVWPQEIRRNGAFQPAWPWVGIYPPGTFNKKFGS